MGGTSNVGVAFSYDIATATYTKLIDFNSATTGSQPDCEIVELPISIETGFATIIPTSGICIFPNPAANAITISNSNREETLQFYNLVGQQLAVVKTSALSKTTLDISNFPSIFFVKTQTGEMQKIVRR